MEPYSTPRPMKQLSSLFEKYKTRFKAPQATVEKECVAVIKEMTGFEIPINQVTYTVSTRTLSIQVPSVMKSELRFHHTTILKQLTDRLGKEACPKIIR